MATHSSVLPWRSLAGYSPWGRKEADTAEQLSTHTCPCKCRLAGCGFQGTKMSPPLHPPHPKSLNSGEDDFSIRCSVAHLPWCVSSTWGRPVSPLFLSRQTPSCTMRPGHDLLHLKKGMPHPLLHTSGLLSSAAASPPLVPNFGWPLVSETGRACHKSHSVSL